MFLLKYQIDVPVRTQGEIFELGDIRSPGGKCHTVVCVSAFVTAVWPGVWFCLVAEGVGGKPWPQVSPCSVIVYPDWSLRW